MPTDVYLVPLVFEAAQRTFAHLAEVAERWRIADEPVDFFLRRRADIHASEDQFQLLNEHALDLEEVSLIIHAEFLRAGHVDEMVKLFPAFEVVLSLLDQWMYFGIAHRT